MDIGRAINYNARQCLQARTGWFWQEREGRPDRGCSSGVEHNLAKVGVVGSNPIARSNLILMLMEAVFRRLRRAGPGNENRAAIADRAGKKSDRWGLSRQRTAHQGCW